MGPLEKAILQEVRSDRNSTPIGDPVPVQFNPETLRLNLTNRIEGGRSRGRQTRQYVGSSSSVMKLDLIFDTADEGTTSAPRSVLERTEIIERFVKPKRQRGRSSETPPKLSFQWGNLIIIGMVESIDLELDLFAANGVPLRAKASVSIKQQSIEFQFPAENAPAGSTPNAPGLSPAAPGSTASATGQSAAALDNETLPEFASRMGLDPTAWRGLDAGVDLSASLSLEAGVEVGFSAELTAGLGLGVTLGVEAGFDASLEASFGLEAGIGINAGVSVSASASLKADLSAGMALSAAGGIGAAVQSVQIAKSSVAVQATRQAFDAPATARNPGAVRGVSNPAALGPAARQPVGSDHVALEPGLPIQRRTPLAALGNVALARTSTGPAPLPPRADTRAASFGFGIPLRPRVFSAVDDRRSVVFGNSPVVQEKIQPGGIVFTNNPTIPPWQQLPSRDASRTEANQIQKKRLRGKSCGCRGPCNHG